jgi:hypothetical protein
VDCLDFKTLSSIVGHLGKLWCELPYSLRNLIELDAPSLARAWDQLTFEQHREALHTHVVKRIEGLHHAIGFHEDDAKESLRLRQELALAHDIIENLSESHDPITWWTVPQAAVSICTRENTAVEELGAQATFLTATELHPRVGAALLCLSAGLREARFDGDQVLPMVRSKGVPAGSSTEANIAVGYWQSAELKLIINDCAERVDVVAFRPAAGGTDWSAINVAAEDCQRLWPSPARILAQRPLSLAEAAKELRPGPVDHLAWFLPHPRVRATGLNAAMVRVSIVFDGPLVVEVDKNSVKTEDDRIAWSSVMLELIAPEAASTATAGGTPQPEDAVLVLAANVTVQQIVDDSSLASLAPIPSQRNRGAAVPKDDDAALAAMLSEADGKAAFSVRDYVLAHSKEIEGPNDEAKVRRLQRKFSEATKACPD